MQLWITYFATAILLVSSASAETLYKAPALPEVSVNTDLSATPVTGKIIHISATDDIDQNGRNLQTAIDKANYGDCIMLPPRFVFRSGSLELRAKAGSGWITIMSELANTDSLPAKRRVGPADAHLMPTLISPGGNDPVILTEPGAHGYRLIGLNITKLDPSSFVQELVVIDATVDQDATTITNIGDFPSNIIIDRCYIHGLPNSDLKRGIRLHCNNCAVVDSYIAEAHVIGQDSQAALLGGKGIKISNNYLSGAAENLFAADYFSLREAVPIKPASVTTATLQTVDGLAAGMGMAFYDGTTNLYTIVRSVVGNTVTYDPLPTTPSGKAVAYWGLIPTDIEIDHNYIYKEPSWHSTDPTNTGYTPVVKNLFELKSGRRVWAHDNILENDWTNGQTGAAVLFTVRNQDNQCYFCAVEDITFDRNIVKAANYGLSVLATDNNYPSGPTRNILVANNLWTNIQASLQVNSIDGLILDHNTALIGAFAEEVEDGAVRSNNVVTNNIILSRYYSGFHYSNGNVPAWDQILPGLVLRNNVMSMVGGIPPFLYFSKLISNANFSVLSPDDVGFVDYGGGDVALAEDSPFKHLGTDELDLGADVQSLLRNQSLVQTGVSSNGVESGQASGDEAGGSDNSSGSSGDPAPRPPGENLERFWFDPSILADPNTPTTLAVASGDDVATAILGWNVPEITHVEIHIGSPTGKLFAAGGSEGTARTGAWVSEGMAFYLQDCSNGKPLSQSSTVGVLVAHLVHRHPIILENTQDLSTFYIDPSTIADPNLPETIRVEPGTKYGVAHLVWNTTKARMVEIRVGSPDGKLFAAGGSHGTATTGEWVADGMAFYLQDASLGNTTAARNTLAMLVVHIVRTPQYMPQMYGKASFFLQPALLPEAEKPLTILAAPKTSSGIADIGWNAPDARQIEIHVGAPSGPLLARAGSQGTAVAGGWVFDGTTFYLQDVSNNRPLGYDGTLGILSVKVVDNLDDTAKQVFGAASFFIDRSDVPNLAFPNTISSRAGGTARIHWNAPGTNRVAIYVGSPSGQLFARGGSRGTAVATGWLRDGLVFYLLDESYEANLLHQSIIATLTIHVSQD